MHKADAIRSACVKSACHETTIYVVSENPVDNYSYRLESKYDPENTIFVFSHGVPVIVNNTEEDWKQYV